MNNQQKHYLFQTLEFLSNQLEQNKNLKTLNKYDDNQGSGFGFFVEDKTDTSKRYLIEAQPIFNFTTEDLDQDKLKFCQQQAQRIRECNHKSIVEIHSDFQIGFYHFIQMNNCIKSLQDWINQNSNKINDNLFLHYANQIIEGVEYLHNKGYVVGNYLVKNIMMTFDGKIKLCNFLFPNQFNNTFKNADFYSKNEIEFFNVPPELMDYINNNNNKEQVNQTQKGDIWALGICFLLLGGLNMSDFIQMNKQYFEKSDLLQKSNKVHKLVNYLLNTNPQKRPNIQEVKQKINQLFYINMNEKQIQCTQQIENIEQQANQIIIERLIDFDSNQVDTVYEKYLQYEKGYPNNVETLITLGYIEVKYHSNFSEAQKYFEKCIELNCNEIDAYLGLCLIIIQDRQFKNFNKAYDYIEHCLKIKNDYWRIYYIKSCIHLQNSRVKEGLEVLEAGLDLNSNSIYLLSLKIIFLFDQIEDYNQAQELSLKVIKLNTDNDPLVNFRIGRNFEYNKNYKDTLQAIYYYQQVYKYNSRDLMTCIALFKNYKSNNNIEESQKYLDRAQNLYPKHSCLLFYLARVEEDQNKQLELYQESLQDDNENRHSYYEIGRIYEDQQKYNEAIKYYQRVLLFKPDDLSALQETGFILGFEFHQYYQALQYYKRVIKMNSFKSSILFEIGCLYYDLNDYEKAIFYLNKFLKKSVVQNSNYGIAKNRLEDCKRQI